MISEATTRAQTDARDIIAAAEKSAAMIVQETADKAATQTADLVAEYEERARKVLLEAEKIAAAPSREKPAHILRALAERAADQSRARDEAREAKKAASQRRTQLLILPPVDYGQLAQLRASLQQIADLRVVSTGGSLEGGATISLHLDQPMPLTDRLKSSGAIEEAIEEDMLDSHPLGDFLKRAMPLQASKKRDGDRILVVLKRKGS